MNAIDPFFFCTSRLFREHCTFSNNVFVKDLSKIGRDMKDIIIIDNSPKSYILQPECGIPIISWYGNPHDNALADLIPLIIQLSQVKDVREVISKFVGNKSSAIDFNAAYSVIQK